MKPSTRRTACALLLCCGMSVLAASSALAQDQNCTPVVYVFRHAEDTNPPAGPIFALTPTGQAHAALYPGMVDSFQAFYNKNYCTVGKVYATTTVTKVGSCGTECTSATNAYDTAKPLASAIMHQVPITRLCDYPQGASKEEVRACELYEYLGNGNSEPATPNYSTDVAQKLRAALLATAKDAQSPAKSSAIFWTSQGMHVLGGAIINRDSALPRKNGAAIPGRNSVYVFKAVKAAGSDAYAGFEDTSLKYVQCFNYFEANMFGNTFPHFVDRSRDSDKGDYVCGYGNFANLGGWPGKACAKDAQCGLIANADNAKVKGRICDTKSEMLKDANGNVIKDDGGLYGWCNDATAGSAP